MSPALHLVFLVFALVCFVVSAWQAAAPNWNKLVSLGLAFLTASMISW